MLTRCSVCRVRTIRCSLGWADPSSPMVDKWVCHRLDLGESVNVDGSPIVGPVVPLIVAAELAAVLGVLDSGSPISVASADLFTFSASISRPTIRCTRSR